MALREPLEVMGDLLDDLSRSLGAEARPVSAFEMATLAIAFEVG